MQPFQIDVPDAVLDDLRQRLGRTRWVNEIGAPPWTYGGDTDTLQNLCDYWQHHFDWRLQEARLNAVPQFLTPIDGVDIHFWHVKGTGPKPFPLLLLHGWPGSVFEFLELVKPLTDPAAYGRAADESFDIVVPAIPGFGFGGKPAVAGWGLNRIAAAFDALMGELGYARYGVQGGDWGAGIGACIARNHADHVIALHTNMPYALPPPGVALPAELVAFRASETAYMQIQATKPDSITPALADSPAGLAAWIIEKFRAWSDCGGDLFSVFSRDTLLTNLMFYWAPPSVASAARIYYEAAREGAARFGPVATPTAVADFPKEPFKVPRDWVEQRFNVVRWTVMPQGGHFPALEQPDLLAADIIAFFAGYR